MNAFGVEAPGSMNEVAVDVYTSSYRVSGTVRTPFGRVSDMLNQLSGGHLTVEHATISEHGQASGALAAPSALVSLEEILVVAAPGLSGEARGEMRIQKRPVRAQLAMAPIRVTGIIHVPMGSRPVDGLLNVQDRFMPMTDVALESAHHPHLDRTCPIVAIRRDRAHILLVADDERPDELLAEVIDERTAEAWLRSGEEPS
ncbi:MAG: hypothetical protein ACRDGD_01940 [Candidatus Limnocylindria bacterium]